MADLASWEQKMSLSYVKNDRRVRKRIVDDDVEFQDDIWGSLQDGTRCATLNDSASHRELFDAPLMAVVFPLFYLYQLKPCALACWHFTLTNAGLFKMPSTANGFSVT